MGSFGFRGGEKHRLGRPFLLFEASPLQRQTEGKPNSILAGPEATLSGPILLISGGFRDPEPPYSNPPPTSLHRLAALALSLQAAIELLELLAPEIHQRLPARIEGLVGAEERPVLRRNRSLRRSLRPRSSPVYYFNRKSSI